MVPVGSKLKSITRSLGQILESQSKTQVKDSKVIIALMSSLSHKQEKDKQLV